MYGLIVHLNQAVRQTNCVFNLTYNFFIHYNQAMPSYIAFHKYYTANLILFRGNWEYASVRIC